MVGAPGRKKITPEEHELLEVILRDHPKDRKVIFTQIAQDFNKKKQIGINERTADGLKKYAIRNGLVTSDCFVIINKQHQTLLSDFQTLVDSKQKELSMIFLALMDNRSELYTLSYINNQYYENFSKEFMTLGENALKRHYKNGLLKLYSNKEIISTPKKQTTFASDSVDDLKQAKQEFHDLEREIKAAQELNDKALQELSRAQQALLSDFQTLVDSKQKELSMIFLTLMDNRSELYTLSYINNQYYENFSKEFMTLGENALKRHYKNGLLKLYSNKEIISTPKEQTTFASDSGDDLKQAEQEFHDLEREIKAAQELNDKALQELSRAQQGAKQDYPCQNQTSRRITSHPFFLNPSNIELKTTTTTTNNEEIPPKQNSGF